MCRLPAPMWALALALPFLHVDSSRSQQQAASPKAPVFDGKQFAASVAILKDKRKDEFVRAAAARALGKLGQPAVAPLTEVLHDESVILRCAAVETLGKIGA